MNPLENNLPKQEPSLAAQIKTLENESSTIYSKIHLMLDEHSDYSREQAEYRKKTAAVKEEMDNQLQEWLLQRLEDLNLDAQEFAEKYSQEITDEKNRIKAHFDHELKSIADTFAAMPAHTEYARLQTQEQEINQRIKQLYISKKNQTETLAHDQLTDALKKNEVAIEKAFSKLEELQTRHIAPLTAFGMSSEAAKRELREHNSAIFYQINEAEYSLKNLSELEDSLKEIISTKEYKKVRDLIEKYEHKFSHVTELKKLLA